MPAFQKYFSFQGRASRKELLLVLPFAMLAVLGIWFLDAILLAVLSIIFNLLHIGSTLYIPFVGAPIGLLGGLVWVWVNLAGVVRRRHDLGLPDRFGFRPLSFDAVLKRGTIGPNEFGPDPLG